MRCKGKNVAKVGNTIVKTNIYRCTEYCPNCPFLDDGLKIGLTDGRVDSIKDYLLESDSNSFSCHKTVYNLDNKMDGSEDQSPKMCKGAFDFLKKKGQPNIMMRLAVSMGIEKL